MIQSGLSFPGGLSFHHTKGCLSFLGSKFCDTERSEFSRV